MGLARIELTLMRKNFSKRTKHRTDNHVHSSAGQLLSELRPELQLISEGPTLLLVNAKPSYYYFFGYSAMRLCYAWHQLPRQELAD